MNTDAINKDECVNSDNIIKNEAPVNSNNIIIDEVPVLKYGWICPKCGSVWSPDTTCCTNCLSMTTTVSVGRLDITDY